MKRTLFPLFAIFAIAVMTLSTNAHASSDCPSYTTPDGVTLLTEGELREKVINNTVDAGDKYQMYYYPDGRLVSIWGSASSRPGAKEGSWKICGSVLSHIYSQWDSIRTISLEGDQISFFKLNGDKRATRTLVSGKSNKYRADEPSNYK